MTDRYFGTTVADPYRWLEAIDSPPTVAWVRAENTLTRSYLDAIPDRAELGARYRRLYNYPRASAPFRAGRYWFVDRNTGLQTQDVLYVGTSERGPKRLFFDPNTLSKDGSIQLSDTSFSRDGTLLAYATQSGGSDWETWHVKRVSDGRDLPDTVAWSKYSGAAWVGNTGFYYAGYDKPANANPTFAKLGVQKAWFHHLGTPQSADRLVADSHAHPDQFLGIDVTYDQRYVFLERSREGSNSLAWRSADTPNAPFAPLLPLVADQEYDLLGNDGPRIYLRTNRAAPRFRLVWIDLRDPAHTLHDVVPQTADALQDATLVGNDAYLAYLHDAHSQFEVAALSGGRPRPIALPEIGTATLAPVRRDDRAIYYDFTSFAFPTSIYRYDPKARQSTLYRRSQSSFDPKPFVTEQLFATSKDGTRVPVFVTHRRDMPLDGNNPTILYGYGGFDISQTPFFSSQNALWLQLGGVYALAVLRGGGEYGEAWHDGGRRLQKQHVFDDFLAVAHLLLDRKVTSTPKLAIDGGSNGGLLVGAALTQAPNLFGAAIVEQGVLDMLRYQDFTVGKAWIPEYGTATQSAAQFKALYAYSPLQNVRDGTAYPPTLITTSDHDDRVFPAHSYKFAAALQHAQSGPAPILLRVQTEEGHFSGLTTDEQVALVADFYAFLTQSLDLTVPTTPSPRPL